MDDWPFDQTPNSAVISLRHVVFERAPILYVTHDSDDHGWQFLSLDDARIEDAVVVSLSEILKLDPSVRELADLPPGWRASRQFIGAPWRREPDPDDDASC
jgi:hypothetical protein